jgi:5'-nucleotidase
MRILVSNDDGIYSPGIAALAEVASEFGSVRVVAPDMERSSAGHSITASRPLSYRPTSVGKITGADGKISGYRVNGTPADCVALGAHHFGRVDVVLSGINLGFNLGNAIWHSGTLAAAKQAALLGVRGIALSGPGGAEDFEPYKPWVRRVLETLLENDTPPLVNVNLPREPRGLVWTRTSVRLYEGRIVPVKDPSGHELYWFSVVPMKGADVGTDRWAVENHFISLTPLRLDLTEESVLQAMRRAQPLDEARAVQADGVREPDAAEQVKEDEAVESIARAAEPAQH